MKIMLAVDGSAYTKRMLSYIAAHDELLGKGHEFVVVTVTPEVPPHVTRFLAADVLQQYYQDEADKVLKPVREFAQQQGWPVRERALVGAAADAIAEVAEQEKPDVLLMGSHGHGAVGGVILGSVSTRVIARTKVPVLLIR